MAERIDTPTATAWIALGSNLGGPLEQLRRAERALAGLGSVIARSGLYRTAPVGGPDGQPPFLNAVLALHPAGAPAPEALLGALQAIERRHGRERRVRWGPRTLDLDLLAYGSLTLDRPGLRLPHPRMMERAFVLVPLCEADPSWRHPVSGEGACAALARLPADAVAGVRRTRWSWSAG